MCCLFYYLTVVALGGVFVTWRQKDREEPQMGLYGKNAFYYTKESEDDIFLIEEFNKNVPKKDLRQSNNSKVRDSTKIIERKATETEGKETPLTGDSGKQNFYKCVCVPVCIGLGFLFILLF